MSPIARVLCGCLYPNAKGHTDICVAPPVNPPSSCPPTASFSKHAGRPSISWVYPGSSRLLATTRAYPPCIVSSIPERPSCFRKGKWAPIVSGGRRSSSSTISSPMALPTLLARSTVTIGCSISHRQPRAVLPPAAQHRALPIYRLSMSIILSPALRT